MKSLKTLLIVAAFLPACGSQAGGSFLTGGTAAPGPVGQTSAGGSTGGASSGGTTGATTGATTGGTTGVTPPGGDSASGAPLAAASDPLSAADKSVPNLGPNVFVFDPTMGSATIQKQLDTIYTQMNANQFGDSRYAFVFKTGSYNVDARVGFYTQVLGAGLSPDDVQITGAVRADAAWLQSNATCNFWRGAENFAVTPTQDGGIEKWAVSQATWLRRVHVKGSINLWDFDDSGNQWSSGGFIADSVVDKTISSGSQQQFLTRNTTLGTWNGASWNMVFVGDQDTPTGNWPGSPYSVLAATPVLREKPYLTIDTNGVYAIAVPDVRKNAQGVSWSAGSTATVRYARMGSTYVAHAGTDTADTINAALALGKHLILTPGIYKIEKALNVTMANTVIYGMGLATLRPTSGNNAMNVADVGGVTISGVLFDAGAQKTTVMLQLGTAGSETEHSANPLGVYDVSCRVGGVGNAAADTCLQVNSSNVLLDNIWMWRADHGDGAGWTTNPAAHGVVVNGNNVTAYGLFVEHFQDYQTLWNGENGTTYFYQSELPYDPPNQAAWKNPSGGNGFASYKVAASVKAHTAMGLGVYSVFSNNVTEDNAIEFPAGLALKHLTTVGLASGQITHIYNGAGNAVTSGASRATSSF